jgi:hypothetical protein
LASFASSKNILLLSIPQIAAISIVKKKNDQMSSDNTITAAANWHNPRVGLETNGCVLQKST